METSSISKRPLMRIGGEDISGGPATGARPSRPHSSHRRVPPNSRPKPPAPEAWPARGPSGNRLPPESVSGPLPLPTFNKIDIDINSDLNKIESVSNIMEEFKRFAKREPRDWTQLLSDEDRAFVKRFVLASGSLKELAAAYGISYPTVRLRLDRLIEKIKVLEDPKFASEFERVVRACYADGRLDKQTLLELVDAHRREMEASSDEDV